MRDTVHDTESFPNFFCLVLKHAGEPSFGAYECSERRNDAEAIAWYYPQLERAVGFNNLNYDYVLLHNLVHAVREGRLRGASGLQVAQFVYNLSQQIIEERDGERTRIWERDHLIPQLDLMKVHHLDNKARATGLKALQFFMRSPSIEETPIPFGTWLTPAQMDEVLRYCVHDVGETERLLQRSRDQVEFREQLDREQGGRGRSWMNLSDTSIGKRYFRERLEEANPGCTRRSTPRGLIRFVDCIFPWIQFRFDPFRRELAKMREFSVDGARIKDSYKSTVLHAGGGLPEAKPFRFDVGVGGMHGSLKRRRFDADQEHEILDIDVTSFYPRLPVLYRFYPLHLGEVFCDIYDGLFQQRDTTQKGTSVNRMLKFALNGVFGDSNNEFGPFFDPVYTLTTTLNGQLLQLMLAESLMEVPGLELIQINTDGLTVRFPRNQNERVAEVIAWWCAGTGLRLEFASYQTMVVRDVNNYIAVADGGKKTKRKGAYEYELELWQDPSALAIPKAVEAALIHGEDPAEFLRRRLIEDPWDFMIRAKVPKTQKGEATRVLWGDQETQHVCRYYVSTGGRELVKDFPPLKLGGPRRRLSLQKGQTVQLANRFDGRPPADLHLGWYVDEARKLII